ncbi:MAG TPA: glycosyltransferase family 2 protein, partial [bacterium]|nr:glycosyltransferase family 2 protein [bacterium]
MPSSPILSVVVITLNEERNIFRCLKSLKFSKKIFGQIEVIVVDAQSRDKTVVTAKQLGAKVYARAWKGYGDQKNWALAKARGNWILSLDADEELTASLIAEIEKVVVQKSDEVDGYFI